MISKKNNYKRLFASVLTLVIISCSNPWDDRENNGDANLDSNLTEAITKTAETSQFADLLVQTGYDKILAASKTYTVFVPTNAAMAEVDEAILIDEDALKQFVANHIALTAYSSMRTSDVRIKMLSNKYLDFEGSNLIDGSTIVEADHYAQNGVYHIIDKALTPKLNIWQYVNAQEGNSAMADYLLSLSQQDYSIYTSDIDAKILSEERGAGYLSDSLTNSYLRNVYNLNNERNNYTLFLLKDAAYGTEIDKMKPYTIKVSNDVEKDSTALYAGYFTLRDLSFARKYKRSELPETLTSRFGVEVPIDKTKIVEEIELSNGVVYVMDMMDVPTANRILTRQIEGESLSTYFNFNRPALAYRDRIDPFGVIYKDIKVEGPGAALPIVKYVAKDFYSTTYKVYWRAINEQANVFSQQLSINGNSAVENNVTVPTDPIFTFPYISVARFNYDEVYLGEFTLNKAQDLNHIILLGANTATNGNNSIVLDYLKFVPVLK